MNSYLDGAVVSTLPGIDAKYTRLAAIYVDSVEWNIIHGSPNINDKYILIENGRLSIQVPLIIFKGNTAVVNDQRAERFRTMLAVRYPWLSIFALNVIIENARKEMESRIEGLKSSSRKARELMEHGRYEEALHHLDQNQGEARSTQNLHLKKEILIRMGRKREGYRSFAQARKGR